jgi:hypothetical protein
MKMRDQLANLYIVLLSFENNNFSRIVLLVIIRLIFYAIR